MAGLISKELVATSIVEPSAGALASAAVATMVPAPGRFSITTDWPPHRADSRSARMRATTSVGPPAANGTRSFTGRDGKSAAVWAAATRAMPVASRKAAAIAFMTVICVFAERHTLAAARGSAKARKLDRDVPPALRAVARAVGCSTCAKRYAPATRRGGGRQPKRRSQPIEDLTGPEPLEALQRRVERGELVAIDAADLGHGGHVLLVERIDDVAHLAPLVGKLDAHRAAVDPRALVIEVSHLHQLLEVVGHVGAEIIAPRAQLAGGEILLADIVQKQRLHRIDVAAAPAVELVLDDVEEATMQPLDQSQGFEIVRTNVVEAPFALDRLHRFGNGFQHDTFPVTVVVVTARLVPPLDTQTYIAGSKIALINTLKIRFTRNGERSIDATDAAFAVTFDSR